VHRRDAPRCITECTVLSPSGQAVKLQFRMIHKPWIQMKSWIGMLYYFTHLCGNVTLASNVNSLNLTARMISNCDIEFWTVDYVRGLCQSKFFRHLLTAELLRTPPRRAFLIKCCSVELLRLEIYELKFTEKALMYNFMKLSLGVLGSTRMKKFAPGLGMPNSCDSEIKTRFQNLLVKIHSIQQFSHPLFSPEL
jgi:hypothetical protein